MSHSRIKSHDIEILVGTYLLNSGGERRRVSKTIVHEKYNGRYSYSYDVALIRLERPIQFSDQVQPIKFSDKVITENEDLLISGWGNLYINNGVQPNSMQEIFLKSISNEECHLKTIEDIHPSHLCTESQFGEGICAVSLNMKLFFEAKSQSLQKNFREILATRLYLMASY